MDLDIDYAYVESCVNTMKELAGKIDACKTSMQYYAYGSVDTEGEYAKSFGMMKTVVQETISDISSFVEGYAKLIDNVALNYDILDQEMKEHIKSRNEGEG